MFILLLLLITSIIAIPEGFVYLSDIDDSIIQEIRYAGIHNFIGYPFIGYSKPLCVLTKQAAIQLSKNQQKALSMGYRLKVWDCYRPQKTVDYMNEWMLNDDEKMKKEFYPNEDKRYLYDKGYVAKRSGHSRGSTLDITLVKYNPDQQEIYHDGDMLKPCINNDRFKDNTLNMGTGFDCFDEKAHTDYKPLRPLESLNRMMLISLMEGFKNYSGEWWHFTLIDEPYPSTYYDFDIE